MPLDIMGDESGEDVMGEIVLAGATDLSGAALPSPKIVVRRPNRGRRLPMGLFSLGLIAAGSPSQVTAEPQTAFRLERFSVPDELAIFFDIVDIKVGKDSIFDTDGRVPATCFDQAATGILLGVDTNQAGTTLSVDVLNKSLAPSIFQALALGIAVV